jgi:hypothetical protein
MMIAPGPRVPHRPTGRRFARFCANERERRPVDMITIDEALFDLREAEIL